MKKGVGSLLHSLGIGCGEWAGPYGVHPSIEGTSGAADCAPLRGGTHEAALQSPSPKAVGPAERVRRAYQSGGTATREGHSTPRAARNATRGVRADRVGAKSIPRAIAVSKVKAPGNCPEPNPLTRDISTGCAPKGELPSAVSPMAVERPARGENELRRRASVGDVLRSSVGARWCSWIGSMAEVDRRRAARRGRM